MKYFIDHVPGSVFNNQMELSEALKNIGKRFILESEELNPLTVRLFNAKKALESILKFETLLSPKGLSNDFFTYNIYMGINPKMEIFSTSAPSGSTLGYQSYLTDQNDWSVDLNRWKPYPNYVLYSVDYNPNLIRVVDLSTPIHQFELHVDIYTFFANIESILDRVRLELNSIYFDNLKILDSSKSKGNKFWKDFINPNNGQIKLMMSSGFNDIASILTGTNAVDLYRRISKYRNRVIHDGILEVNINTPDYKIYIPNDPENNPNSCNERLVEFSQMIFNDLLILLQKVYQQIIDDLKGKTALPLIV